ncbi:TetR/AcrR family transcriptional regulator [uncultured Cocleimonas sp.]|uniref:TetR/AcrR family transcriptional regulator n=1 Tax=uncultured Cocleimonas sp. TaxID=1051587 RepID=UPI00261AFF96|nr:TetR/AcrR family transcriptional regulator [uncultured Cocleimonas sp.]
MNAGRKRNFEKDEALDKAMRVFWENGYSGTSLSDLTTELGINKPSLYAAFGNKEKLFESSIERYVSEYIAPRLHNLDTNSDAPVKQKLKDFLYSVIELQTENESPNGCFFVKSQCESGSVGFPEDMTLLIEKMNVMNEEMVKQFFQSEISKGHFTKDADPKEMSGFLLSVLFGLAVQARSGKSRKQLQQIANYTINALPILDVNG